MQDESLCSKSFIFTSKIITLLWSLISLFFLSPLTLNKLNWFFLSYKIILSVSLIPFENHRIVWTQKVDKANLSVDSYQSELFRSPAKPSISIFSEKEFISCFVHTLACCESDKFISFRNWLSSLWQLSQNYFCGLWSKWWYIIYLNHFEVCSHTLRFLLYFSKNGQLWHLSFSEFYSQFTQGSLKGYQQCLWEPHSLKISTQSMDSQKKLDVSLVFAGIRCKTNDYSEKFFLFHFLFSTPHLNEGLLKWCKFLRVKTKAIRCLVSIHLWHHLCDGII